MRYTPFYNHFNMEKHCTMVYFSLRESKQNKKGLSAQLQISVAYFCSIGLYFLV